MQVTGLGAIIGFDRPTQMKNEKLEVGQNSPDASSSSLSSLSKPSTKASTKLEKVAKKSNEKSKLENGTEPQSFENVLANTASSVKPELAKADSDKDSSTETSELTGAGLQKRLIETETETETAKSAPIPMAVVASSTVATHASTASRSAAASTDDIAAAIQSALLGQTVGDGLTGQETDAESLLGELTDVVGSESALRQDSMQLFLNRMKEEFGVAPSKILGAFAKLDQAALKAAPEQTAENVLQQLELQPEQMPKAERYYREMLLTTGESALNEQLAGAQIGAALGVSVKVLSEKEEALQKLDQAILSLNDSFAMRAPAKESAAVPLEVSSSSVPIEPTVASGANSANNTSNANDAKDDQEKNSKFDSIAQALSAAVAAPSTSAGGKSGAESSSDSSSRQPKGQAAKAVTTSSIEKSIEDASLLTMPVGGGEKAAIPLAAGTATSASLAQVMLKQGDAGAPENVQDVVRGAQLLVQKGGGEMKMQLRPEGLGEVHLKVSVKDGQVAIQMMTDSDSAKRALEKGLDDLKTNLASHRLQIDALKVDVNTDLAKQRFEQGSQESNRDQARQMAQDFMGQFRQDREGFRQGFSEGFGMRNYQQPRRQPAPEAEAVSSSTAAIAAKSKSSGSGGDRRLNLVA